jgi:ferric-dicitrate binding protein FerR (iron transport regulator)
MQNSNKKIDNSILKRYLEGNGSDEDRSIVKQWFANNDLEHELYENSLLFWEDIPLQRNSKGYNGSYILDMIHHKIKIEEAIFLTKIKPGIRFIDYLTRIAAILFIPLLLASLLFYFQNNSLRNVISYSEIYSPVGTRTTFYLPDGTTGLLNGGSSLKFPTQFSGKTREVKLTGEAYFRVTPNHEKPFIVSTGKINVKVFGTSFNVMAYADEQLTEVTLESGQIELFKKTNNSIKSIGVLKPNESCIYNSQSDSSKILSVATTDKLSWIDGKLTFKYEPFEEVVRKINRWYNVNIMIKDEVLDSYIYYGTFEDETLEEVLRLLRFTAPIRYRDFDRERKQDGTFEKRKIEIYYKR